MNLITLNQDDFIDDRHVRLSDRRLIHITQVLNAQLGDQLMVGRINGHIGQGKIVQLSDTAVELEVSLDQSPPSALPLTLIIPMIRPPMFKRLLFHATTLGIKKIYVINFSRVEKSLWNSSTLRPEEIHAQLILGLEQAKDTVLPIIEIREKFKPFIEDELTLIAANTIKIVAHPGGQQINQIPHQSKSVTLVIGPEGGLIPFEIDQLTQLGFKTADLGARILRVDTALPYVIGKLF